jgi:hypothetical protein
MSPDPDDLVARIAGFETPESCEQFAKNVEARGRSDLARLARRRAIEIRAERHGAETTAERDALEAVYAYERTLFLRHGKVVHASRTWQMIKRRGIIPAVEQVVTRLDESTGYEALVSMGLQDKSFEAVVLRHPGLFSERAVQRSRERLRLAEEP